jgi:hypothetical protein
MLKAAEGISNRKIEFRKKDLPIRLKIMLNTEVAKKE